MKKMARQIVAAPFLYILRYSDKPVDILPFIFQGVTQGLGLRNGACKCIMSDFLKLLNGNFGIY